MSDLNEVKYAKTSCEDCYAIIEKRFLFKIRTTKESGYSRSASVKPLSQHPLRTLSVGGRSYHRYVDIWLCKDCYDARKQNQSRSFIRKLLFFSMIFVGSYYYLQGDTERSIPTSTDLSSTSTNNIQTSTPEGKTLKPMANQLENKVTGTTSQLNNDKSGQAEVVEKSALEQTSNVKDSLDKSNSTQEDGIENSSIETLPKDNKTPITSVRPCESMKLC